MVVGRWIRSLEALPDRLVRRGAFTSDAPRKLVAEVREEFLSSRPRALAGTVLAGSGPAGSRMVPGLTVPTPVVPGDDGSGVPGAGCW